MAAHRVWEDQSGSRRAIRQRLGALSPPKKVQRCTESSRQIDLPPLVVLRGRHFSVDDRALNQNRWRRAAPRDIAPFQSEQFAATHSCPEGAKEPRVPRREVTLG